MHPRPLSVLLLVLLCSSISLAQRSSVPPQSSQLEVHVITSGNRSAQGIIQVVLENEAGKQVTDAVTNHEGIAVFQSVRPGNYRLRIEGVGIIAARTESVTVSPGEGKHVEYVRVSSKTDGTLGRSVSVADMKIPEEARKEMDMGVEAIEKSELTSATEHLQKAIQLYPEYSRAWNNLGVAKMKAGDKQGARAAWEHAVAADDKLSVAYLNLARIAISEKRPADAEELIRKALITDPEDPWALLLMSTANAMNGQWPEALTNARKVRTESDPKKFAEAHRIAGEALVNLGQPENALLEYATYLRDYPDSPQAEHIRQQIATATELAQTKANSNHH
jgi:tetratricopeptide (TPR) repeat protein